jgi:hypothetical protein
MKQLQQIQQQQQQAGNHQQQQPATPQQQQQQQQQDRLGGVTVDVSNSFRPNDPVYGGLEPSPSTNSTGTGKVLYLFSCILYIGCWILKKHFLHLISCCQYNICIQGGCSNL